MKILRLMLRHNGLERLSITWLEAQEMNIMEIFIVENDLKSIPPESLAKLQNLQAITIQSHNLKRIPIFTNLQHLKYINVQSASLTAINEKTFQNLPNLERLYIQGSPNLEILKENAMYNLPKLRKLEIINCGINVIHMRAFSLLSSLKELSLSNNRISDAAMVGSALRDLPQLSLLNLNHNEIDKLSEGAFVDQPMLETLYLSNNNINIIHHGAFHRVPKLRVVDLNYNKINRIHPESFLQQSGSGVEELTLIGNMITHISEFRALLDALPRLRFLDMSENLLEEIPRGALRGHPSLERLHLNKNSIKFIQADAFMAMPALRELHLSNNSLNDLMEGPFWNLPALKGLDLSNNYFQRLQPKLLYNLPALRRINLSNNQLTMIDPITFLESPLLEHVNISGNVLASLHPATFRHLSNLYELDSSSNKLIEFVPGLPRGLEHLYLQRNQITNLPVSPSPDLDLPSLRSLDISSNGIQKIPHGSMKTLHNLRRLYMKRNGLRQIDTFTFSDLARLEILDISDNQIISVHPKSFNKLSNLVQVNLHGNTIENFDFVSIQDNVVLSTIDFSKNKLKNLSQNLVNKALDLEILNISSNNLHELPQTLNILPKLKVLDASYNHIKHFDGNIINNIQSLIEINMPFNKITEIKTGSFENLRDLVTINLDSNNIEVIHTKALSNLPSLLSIYLTRNHIIDMPDRVLSNLPKLKIIDLQGNRLQYISPRAFDNLPLVQYLNVSHNQLTNIDNSGLRQISSLEVLDLSFNRLSKISQMTFQYMEWLVELNIDNNNLCYISGHPFDYMPRLKVLSLRNNKLQYITETSFAKLRNNIAILDIDGKRVKPSIFYLCIFLLYFLILIFLGNPLICNCKLIWLKSWLQESSSIGPKCADGTYVKSMPFSKSECEGSEMINEDFKSCAVHDNEALLPNLATSQVFSSLDKIKDYHPQINNNKVTNRPTPEESEYFYDEYVDYPYNDTLINGLNNENPNNFTQVNVNKSQYTTVNNPTSHFGSKNQNPKDNVTSTTPTSGFTFFGMPLPALDVGKFWNSGRKIDWPESKHSRNSKNFVPEQPKFETGGFSPILPTTAGGFMPIPNPSTNITQTLIGNQGTRNYTNQGNVEQNITAVAAKPLAKNVQSNSTHKKIKTEIHELQAYMDNDNNTQISYNNRTKNVQEQKSDPSQMSKYNLRESNVTITQVTEKEAILITTDTSNDMSLQHWMETSTVGYVSSTPFTTKPSIRKSTDTPTALSAILAPNTDDIPKRNPSKRPATVTKVNIPHIEHHDLHESFSAINNREAKTRFSDSANAASTRTREADGREWYYKNYNKSNLEPYIAPGVHTSKGVIQNWNKLLLLGSIWLLCSLF